MKALDLAKYIIQKSDDIGTPVSNLQLQKMLYFINLVYLKRNGDFLIDREDEFYAWPHGTVIPDIYKKFSIFGAEKIPAKNLEKICLEEQKDGGGNTISEELVKIIDKKIEKFAKLDPWLLVYYNHQEHGAWYHVFKKEGKEWDVIDRELVKKEAGF